MVDVVSAACLCGSEAGTPERIAGLPMIRCRECDVLRQDVRLDEAALAEWYAERYFDGVYTHTYQHDRQVAEKRLDSYALAPGTTLLDVGCGNGAFVDVARERGLNAWGQDLADASGAGTYVGRLDRIAFPPDSFDVVTVHDVLEHVPDPRAFLVEISRLLRPHGTLLLDFPRFFHEAGAHHWKSIEHIWMLTEEQIEALLADVGLRVHERDVPVESKLVFRAENLRVRSTARILVPPGIGDGYWVFTKLRGFLDRLGIFLPKLYVHDSGPRRSGAFWERVPFVRFSGFERMEDVSAKTRAYQPPGVAVQQDVAGFDYFISFNGSMDAGRSLDDAMEGRLDWYEPLHVPGRHASLVDGYRSRFGDDYVLAAFWARGFYAKWNRDFTPADMLDACRRIADAGRTLVLMGADWDRGGLLSDLAESDERFVDMIGDTTFEELFALVAGAGAVFGHPAGNTMLGPYLGRPTTLVWGNTFPTSFRTNALPPRNDYVALDAKTANGWSAAVNVLRPPIR